MVLLVPVVSPSGNPAAPVTYAAVLFEDTVSSTANDRVRAVMSSSKGSRSIAWAADRMSGESWRESEGRLGLRVVMVAAWGMAGEGPGEASVPAAAPRAETRPVETQQQQRQRSGEALLRANGVVYPGQSHHGVVQSNLGQH